MKQLHQLKANNKYLWHLRCSRNVRHDYKIYDEQHKRADSAFLTGAKEYINNINTKEPQLSSKFESMRSQRHVTEAENRGNNLSHGFA